MFPSLHYGMKIIWENDVAPSYFVNVTSASLMNKFLRARTFYISESTVKRQPLKCSISIINSHYPSRIIYFSSTGFHTNSKALEHNTFWQLSFGNNIL